MIFKLFNDYSLTIYEAKHKIIRGKGIPSILAHAAKVSNRKIAEDSNLKILSPKQMLTIITNSFCTSKSRLHLKTY